jgi:hypothetical protein
LYQKPSRNPVVLPSNIRSAGRKSVVGARCPSAQLFHHLTPPRTACPIKISTVKGAGLRGPPDMEISRCHGMLQMKGKVRRMHEPPPFAESRPRLVPRDTNAVFCDCQDCRSRGLLADDDFHAGHAKLQRTRAMVDVAAPESLTCLSSKLPRSTGYICEMLTAG